MAAAYSMDLRARVLKDADAGRSSKELAERYHVSRAWVDALKQRRRETGLDRAAAANQVSGAGAGRSGGPVGGADRGATRCHARGVTRGPADHRGP